jgi:hypothetical protein
MLMADEKGLVSSSTSITVFVQIVRHVPDEQAWLDGHAAGLAHCPHESQVCSSVVLHRVALGVHTGVAAQEHASHAHVPEQVCVPYVLQSCIAPVEHTPWPAHVPLVCHMPLVLQVCVSVPQLPQVTGSVCPGAQTPAHAPLTHVWSEQVATGVSLTRSGPHLTTVVVLEQTSCPGLAVAQVGSMGWQVPWFRPDWLSQSCPDVQVPFDVHTPPLQSRVSFCALPLQASAPAEVHGQPSVPRTPVPAGAQASKGASLGPSFAASCPVEPSPLLASIGVVESLCAAESEDAESRPVLPSGAAD